MKKLLFICSKNQLRSPTAEVVFSEYPNLDVRSAGLSDESPHKVDSDDLEWAEYIFVMETAHKSKLQQKYRNYLRDRQIIVLDISDNFYFMQPSLVTILKTKVARYI